MKVMSADRGFACVLWFATRPGHIHGRIRRSVSASVTDASVTGQHPLPIRNPHGIRLVTDERMRGSIGPCVRARAGAPALPSVTHHHPLPALFHAGLTVTGGSFDPLPIRNQCHSPSRTWCRRLHLSMSRYNGRSGQRGHEDHPPLAWVLGRALQSRVIRTLSKR
jgi:hypothetical protein